MSQYTSFIRGMLDNCLVSKKYWATQKEALNIQKTTDNSVKSTLLICNKLIALDRDIALLTPVLNQFVEYDNT